MQVELLKSSKAEAEAAAAAETEAVRKQLAETEATAQRQVYKRPANVIICVE